jgi:hypothetical protein
MRIPATATLAGFSSRAAAHDGKSRVLDPEPLHRWLFCSPDSGVRPGLLAVSGLAVPSWPMADAALSLAGLLPLDLLHYLVHRLEHAVPFFWRIHAPHHSDPDVDVTTARRFGITRSRSSSPRPPIGSPCRARYPRLRCAEPRPRGFHHGCCLARQCSLARAVGAVPPAGAGHDGPSPHPPFRLIRPSELELWCGPLLLGSPLRHVPLHYTSAAGRHRFRGA